jgi:hypothetical protein
MLIELEMQRHIREHYRAASVAWSHRDFQLMIRFLKEVIKDTEALILYLEKRHGRLDDHLPEKTR